MRPCNKGLVEGFCGVWDKWTVGTAPSGMGVRRAEGPCDTDWRDLMATYFFETITPAQALSFTALTDTLVFSNPTSSGNKVSVLYTPGGPVTVPSETVTDLVTGRSVVFGPGFV